MAATIASPAAASASSMRQDHSRTNKSYHQTYRPPPSRCTSATTTPNNRTTSTPTDYFSAVGSRKRSRAGSSLEKSMYTSTEVLTPAWYTNARSPSDDGACSIFSTESLVVNDRYKLAGGYDTPALLATDDFATPLDLDVYSRRCMDNIATPTLRLTDPTFAGPLARERNGLARGQRQEQHTLHSPSWTKLALSLPLSLAGKVFSFGTTVLKGFYAGQGDGYKFGGTQDAYAAPSWQPDLATPVPGQWYEPPRHSDEQDTSFEGDFEQDNSATSATRPPPTKRRITDKDWIVVESNGAEAFPALASPHTEAAIVFPTPSSPKRRPSTATTPRAGRPRTSSRRSFMTHSRRQSYNNASPSTLTSPQQPHISHPIRLSMPSSPTRLSHHSPITNPAFPSPDAERFARRQAKQERAADRTMNSMSRQLEELIRQGQAALGTKFTVEDDGCDEDEGFVDEH